MGSKLPCAPAPPPPVGFESSPHETAQKTASPSKTALGRTIVPAYDHWGSDGSGSLPVDLVHAPRSTNRARVHKALGGAGGSRAGAGPTPEPCKTWHSPDASGHPQTLP